MLRNDFADITSLISYIKDTKPYHTKLTDVVVEYQHNDDINVGMEESHKIHAHLSSVWELDTISDGVTNRYRLPAVVLPRYSQGSASKHLWTKQGVVDEIPSQLGAYRVPYNNGMEVLVNGIVKKEGVHYNLVDPIHDIVYFTDGNHPIVTDVIHINLIHIDRLFISVDGQSALYKIEGYDTQTERYDPYVDGFDSASWDVFAWDDNEFDESSGTMILDKDQNYLDDGGGLFVGHQAGLPIGAIKVRLDSNGREYYEFVFADDIFANSIPRETRLLFRVEQTETYNNIARTVISEELIFKDSIRYKDTIGVGIVENAPIKQGFDIPDFGSVGFDIDVLEHEWISIRQGFVEHTDVVGEDSVHLASHDYHFEDLTASVTEFDTIKIGVLPADGATVGFIENQRNGFDTYPFDTHSFDFTEQAIRMIAAPKENASPDALTTSITDEVTFTITDLEEELLG